MDKTGKILGKTYFRDPEVNKGFYSKKREGVADVDPKVRGSNVHFLFYFLLAGHKASNTDLPYKLI